MFGYLCFPSLGPPGGLAKLREEHWCGDDSGGPVAKTLLLTQGAQVHFLVRS